jgi:hypothetical protein
MFVAAPPFCTHLTGGLDSIMIRELSVQEYSYGGPRSGYNSSSRVKALFECVAWYVARSQSTVSSVDAEYFASLQLFCQGSRGGISSRGPVNTDATTLIHAFLGSVTQM